MHWFKTSKFYPVGIYLLKVNNRNTITRCEICSKLTIKTPERYQWRRSGVFLVCCEHILHLVLVFLFLTLNDQLSTKYGFRIHVTLLSLNEKKIYQNDKKILLVYNIVSKSFTIEDNLGIKLVYI